MIRPWCNTVLPSYEHRILIFIKCHIALAVFYFSAVICAGTERCPRLNGLSLVRIGAVVQDRDVSLSVSRAKNGFFERPGL